MGGRQCTHSKCSYVAALQKRYWSSKKDTEERSRSSSNWRCLFLTIQQWGKPPTSAAISGGSGTFERKKKWLKKCCIRPMLQAMIRAVSPLQDSTLVQRTCCKVQRFKFLILTFGKIAHARAPIPGHRRYEAPFSRTRLLVVLVPCHHTDGQPFSRVSGREGSLSALLEDARG